MPTTFDLATALKAADEAKELGRGSTDDVQDSHQTTAADNGNLLTGTMASQGKPEILEDPVATDPEPATAAEAHILREALRTQGPSAIPQTEPETPERPSVRASLFARVTGVGRSKSKSAEAPAQRLGSGARGKVCEPKVQDIREVPAAAEPIVTKELNPTPTPTPVQPSVKFSEVTPTERLVPPVSDDDQLEIPAFLRRQAN
jgi:cell division protein FtsZ